jgi:anti-sigma B factor antagonist
MEIRQSSSDGVQITEIIGRLDATTALQLEDVLQRVLDESASKVLLDCREMTYVSSMGLRTFMVAGKMLHARGGVLAFASLNPQNSQIFEMTSLSKLFPCYADRASALSELSR